MSKFRKIEKVHTAENWAKYFCLFILVYASVIFYLWNTSNFSLAPSFTDMIGQATMENVNVNARVLFYFKAAGLFIVLMFFFFVLRSFLKNVTSLNGLKKILLLNSLFAVLILVNQVFYQDPSYRFLLFFLCVVFLQFAVEIVFNSFSKNMLHLFALFSGATISFIVYPATTFFLPFLVLQLTVLYLLIKWYPVIAKRLQNLFSCRLFWVAVASACIIFICYSLIVGAKNDLYVLIQHVYITRSLKGIPVFTVLAPFILYGPVFLIVNMAVKRGVSANRLILICSGLVFIIVQFSRAYRASLLMMLAFFIVSIIVEVKSSLVSRHKATAHYTLSFDLILSISLFYLINEAGIAIISNNSLFLLPAFFLVFIFAKSRFLKEDKISWFYKQSAFVAFAPVIILLSKELFMVLNSHSVFMGKKGYVFVLLILFLITYLITVSWKTKSLRGITSLYFTVAIAGFAVYNAYNAIWVGQIDFFEDASSAIAVKRSFLSGEIPMLNYFSPHNLNDYITGIFYSFLNGNALLGYKIYSCLYGLFFLLYYFVLRRLFKSSYFAFIFILFSSAVWTLLPLYHSFVLIPMLILYDYFKKPVSIGKVFITAGVLLFSLVFRSDIGVALLASMFVVIPVLAFSFKGGKKKVISLLGAMLLMMLFTAGMILVTKGYQVMLSSSSLILEYLRSAQSWGFSGITRIVNYKFIVQYFIFPVFVLVILVYSLLVFLEKRKGISFQLYILIFLCVYYVANFQRGLVRHSFMEFTDVRLSSFVFFIIALFISYYFFKSRKQRYFIPTFILSSALILFLFKFPDLRDVRSIYTASIDKLNTNNALDYSSYRINRFQTLKKEGFSEKQIQIFRYPMIGELVNIYKAPQELNSLPGGEALNYRKSESFINSERYNARYQTVKKLIDDGVIMGYVDEVCYRPMLNYFLNDSSIHFFNQGLHFYHNKHLQQVFINDLEKSNCRFILVNNVSQNLLSDYLDFVPHSVRHSYIFQYIYKNFHPYAIVDDKTLWVRDTVAINVNLLSEKKLAVNGVIATGNALVPASASRYMISASGIDPVNNDSVIVNGVLRVPVAFYNEYLRLAYVLIEKPSTGIHSIRFGRRIDSLIISEYEYYPDVYSSIPRKYNLKMLPYVTAQFQKSPIVPAATVSFPSNQSDTVPVKLWNSGLSTSGAGLYFQIRNRSTKSREIVVQYFAGVRLLGQFSFSTNPENKTDQYLLMLSSQINWNFERPDNIKIIKTNQSQILQLSFINSNDISY